MSKPDRSRVISFAEAQAAIPGGAGQRSVRVWQRGTVDVAFSKPVPPNEQVPQDLLGDVLGDFIPGQRQPPGPANQPTSREALGEVSSLWVSPARVRSALDRDARHPS